MLADGPLWENGRDKSQTSMGENAGRDAVRETCGLRQSGVNVPLIEVN